ncbi:hypothetical protein FDI21_gp159 [Pseudomonas phage Noxifer]|uniref:Uncharacterized protein n=1 Tax=Pseudomonas phage Noxifer TaxID=2006684 RepID=A0A1Y0T1C2_9CAUD|nr:hypothetical protein FDI21_gp159 [Pseudomonas phage Noxifer]ARV77328.1 hypothetical protein NOXIFER_159 [Pseudomonas phage Noxifer]
MSNIKTSVVAQAYYLIRARDVELAEDFYHRCPRDIRSIRELNAFFHQLMAQYSADTFSLRLNLVDTQDFSVWAQSFLSNILPFLMLNRFPQNTTLRVSSYYSDLQTLAQRSFGQVAAAH